MHYERNLFRSIVHFEEQSALYQSKKKLYRASSRKRCTISEQKNFISCMPISGCTTGGQKPFPVVHRSISFNIIRSHSATSDGSGTAPGALNAAQYSSSCLRFLKNLISITIVTIDTSARNSETIPKSSFTSPSCSERPKS